MTTQTGFGGSDLAYLLGTGIPDEAFGPRPSRYLPASFDPAASRAVARMLETRAHRVQTSSVLSTEALEILHRSAVEAGVRFLTSVIGLGGLQPGSDLEEALIGGMGTLAPFLGHIASDETVLVNVRGLAARLVVAHGGSASDEWTAVLRASNSTLVRIGVVLGLADAGDWESVRRFLDDPSPAVATEAQFLLDDADDD